MTQFRVPTQFIDKYIKPACRNDEKILSAFRQVPREFFVDEAMRAKAYNDDAQPIGFGQTISQPSLVAMMLYELETSEEMNCLEIGAGSGYVTALLSKLVKDVYALEYLPDLVDRANKKLRHIFVRNAYVVKADGSKGYPERAPFDRILVSAGAASMPQALEEQLAEGGIMIIPLNGTLIKAVKNDGKISTKALAKVAFVDFINT